MNRLSTTLLATLVLLLTACGEYVPPGVSGATPGARQTTQAREERPTLVPLPPRPTPTALPPMSDVLQIQPDDPRALGDPAAKVLIVEFTDYE